MFNSFTNRISKILKGKDNAPQLKTICEDKDGNRHINLEGDFENMSAEDLGKLIKEVGQAIKEENEREEQEKTWEEKERARLVNEFLDNTEYCIDDDGVMHIRHHYNGLYSELTRKDVESIYEKLDYMANSLGQPNKSMVVKYIQDIEGLEYMNIVER